ncbi:MAG: SDR family NAD(P)-dependent oxidoreductase [Bacteroidota bacterium]
MHASAGRNSILITGGTSGLGLELVKLFLKKDYLVIATGRKPLKMVGYEDRFRLYRTDFEDMKKTAATIRAICRDHQISYVVNNAGVLSPPDFKLAGNGHEYTFQVNFLSHLLINEIIIRENRNSCQLRIAAITSLVHKLAKTDMNYCRKQEDYSALKAYSDSKFFLSLMCRHLADKYQHAGVTSFSLDPGVFVSSIYRMQKGWFRFLYRIAAPFMRRPSGVARVLGEIMTEQDLVSGAMYGIRKKVRTPKDKDPALVEIFWNECYSFISEYLE